MIDREGQTAAGPQIDFILRAEIEVVLRDVRHPVPVEQCPRETARRTYRIEDTRIERIDIAQLFEGRVGIGIGCHQHQFVRDDDLRIELCTVDFALTRIHRELARRVGRPVGPQRGQLHVGVVVVERIEVEPQPAIEQVRLHAELVCHDLFRSIERTVR